MKKVNAKYNSITFDNTLGWLLIISDFKNGYTITNPIINQDK
jgi:hypothetical protein